MTLDDPGFANLIIAVLAAPVIIGAAWDRMRRVARRDAIDRHPITPRGRR